EAVRSLLGGARLEDAVGLTVLLLTVDEEGWPRIAMLSAGEVLATGPRSLRVALWPHSSSTANPLRSPHATLALVHGGAGWYLRCRVTGGHELALPDGRRLAGFELRSEEALEDVVPYAELTGGISFRLPEPEPVLAAWRETVRAMRSASWGAEQPER